MDGKYDLTFSIYPDTVTGTPLWTEQHDSVLVGTGVFSVVLGSITSIPDSLFAEVDRWLGIVVNTDPEMTPRMRITSVPYAFETSIADSARSIPEHNHNDLYYQKDELSDNDSTINDPSNPVDWVKLKSVPAGFADGTDDVGVGGGWVDDGSVVRLENHNDSVGIGTNAPQEKLHVSGTVWMKGFHLTTGASNGYVLTSDPSGAGTWQPVAAVADGDWTVSGNDLYSTPPGSVGVGTTTPAAKLDIRGSMSVGADASGHDVNFYGGTQYGRLFWDADKMALRAGLDWANENWDPDSVGSYSVGMSYNPKAIGTGTVAIGHSAVARGERAVAVGSSVEAFGSFTTALGHNNRSIGYGSTSMGFETDAEGQFSTSMGGYTTATGDYSIAAGAESDALGDYSAAIGRNVTAGPAANTIVLGSGINGSTHLINNTENSLMVGFSSTEPTLFVGGPNQRVGVGTASPSAKLEVEGSMRVNDMHMATEASDVIDYYYAPPGAGTKTLRLFGNSATTLSVRLLDGDLEITEGSLQVDGTGSSYVQGNFGVGTSSPIYGKLHVESASGTGGFFTGGDHGVYGEVAEHAGSGQTFIGVRGSVYGGGSGTINHGVSGVAFEGFGTNYGVYGSAWGGTASKAGYFNGSVTVTGIMSKGGGSFMIDHPLDPENKYLYHSFVESPDMMNVYNGNVVLDAGGEATVELPHYFGALNKDFRYQLTPVGAPAPNLYVAEGVRSNRFRIAGGESGMTVSWQVTGVRKDAFAEENRIAVEVEKSGGDRGKYLHPTAFGLGREMGVNYEADEELIRHAESRARPEG
jgi:hypothetical protein